ncbi:hypothetical protein HPB48_020265 [Haemaphysalis longicornis]|uniref:PA domain-containing protein n=1 Tax=Haemaphysalis longicornis TaxID=44386 RepID=A0A9J6GQY0_HAELO|nr:hypothetical protein HPB48_020265 [Haemaphysalis longicornis]
MNTLFLSQPVRCANKPEEAVVLLKAENATPVFFCAANIPAIKSIPKEEEEAEFHPFLNMVNETECDYERRAFEGKLVLVDRCKNTTNDELIEQAKSAKAAGVLVSVNAKKSVVGGCRGCDERQGKCYHVGRPSRRLESRVAGRSSRHHPTPRYILTPSLKTPAVPTYLVTSALMLITSSTPTNHLKEADHQHHLDDPSHTETELKG